MSIVTVIAPNDEYHPIRYTPIIDDAATSSVDRSNVADASFPHPSVSFPFFINSSPINFPSSLDFLLFLSLSLSLISLHQFCRSSFHRIVIIVVVTVVVVVVGLLRKPEFHFVLIEFRANEVRRTAQRQAFPSFNEL